MRKIWKETWLNPLKILNKNSSFFERLKVLATKIESFRAASLLVNWKNDYQQLQQKRNENNFLLLLLFSMTPPVLFPPGTTKVFELILKENFRLWNPIKRKNFHYRKLTSIKRVSCLNKTCFTYLDLIMFVLLFLVTRNRKLFISLSEKPDFEGKNSVTKDYISIVNCQHGNS